MNDFTELYRISDQLIGVIGLLGLALVVVSLYPYWDKYRRTENYKQDQKQSHTRRLKRDEQKHERQMARIKNKNKK